MVGGVSIVAAGTGVHRGHEHEGAGILDAVLGATDGNGAVLQRLAQHLKDTARELWQLVEKEDTIMGEADFARLRVIATTHKGHL